MTMMTDGPSATAVARKIVYAVTERGERSFWTRVGMAFPNRDGSTTIRLEAMPISGVLQIRDDEPGPRQRGGAL
ncbi:MAG: hypothetical protein WCJ30_02960 [Deltaproteobacteria bacterium]